MKTADDLALLDRHDHPLLTGVAGVVEYPDVARPFIPAMIALANRLGLSSLSAPVIGVPLAFFITRVTGDMPRIFVNPIIEPYGAWQEHTIVLPIGNETVKRKRRRSVRVHALDLNGDRFMIDTRFGYFYGRSDIGAALSLAIQLEQEYLDGIDPHNGEPYQ